MGGEHKVGAAPPPRFLFSSPVSCVLSRVFVTMANWIRRSPQGSECVVSPQAPGCEGVQAPTQIAATTTGAGAPEVVNPTTLAQDSYITSATINTGLVVTGLVTDSAGSAQTAVLTTATASATPAVIKDPPETVAQATSKSKSQDGVSKGAVAGIAIGTCIIGAAIAFAIAFLLLKRRDRKFVQKTCPSGYPIYADSSPELIMVQKSAATGSPYVQVSQTQMRTPVPVPSRVPVPTQQNVPSNTLAAILPPTADEHDVRNRVSMLFGQIHRHIDTYYRDVHASITPSMDLDFASFGNNVNMLELLQSCVNPTTALKHALVAFILSITEPRRIGAAQTLWPDELTHIPYTHNSGKRDSTEALHPITDEPTDSAQVATAQALHRRLSVYLYTQANTPIPTSPSQSRLSNLSALSLTRKTSSAIREAAEHFSLTFFPWANPTFGDQERESDLAGIIGEALECRIWLYGQTGEWMYEWEVPSRGAVVVAPSLVVREDGRGPRRVVLDQCVVGI